MTNHYLNRYGMLNAVLAVLTKWLTVVMDTPVLAAFYTELKGKKEEIKKNSKALKNARKGKVASKNDSLLAAIEAILPIKGALVESANKSGDQILLAKVDVSRSDLKNKLREDKSVEQMEDIMEEARSHPDVMTNAKITAEDLDAAQALLDQAEAAEDTVDTGATSASTLRKKEIALMKEALAMLDKRGDEILPIVKKNNPAMLEEYKAARVIKDLGGKQKQPADEEVETAAPKQ